MPRSGAAFLWSLLKNLGDKSSFLLISCRETGGWKTIRRLMKGGKIIFLVQEKLVLIESIFLGVIFQARN